MTVMEESVVKELERLRQRAERERKARLEAESVAEAGTRQIYERQRAVELLQVITDAANSAESPETCLEVTLRKWCEFTGWPVGHACVLRDDPPRLVSARLWNLDQPQAFEQFREVSEQMEFVPGVGLPGRVLRNNRSIWIVDINDDPNFPRSKDCPHLNLHSAFGFPARVGDEVVAVLEFFSTNVEEPNEEWLALAAQAGTQIGRVFERQRARLALEKEVQERHRAEEELKALQPKLIEASRDAGRAEVATGVLHNVGNVLNSVNISVTELREMIMRSSLPLLAKSVEMFAEHRATLADFLANDPKGKILPGFIERLSVTLAEENARLKAEVAAIEKHLGHVKQIVNMQQAYARSQGVAETETFEVTALIEDALQLVAPALASGTIVVERRFNSDSMVAADRTKALQILVNLLRNAQQAVHEARNNERRIILITEDRDSDCVAIVVEDNGIGIPPENLTKVFQFGFTTKAEGHGFGLHTSALAARELKGALSVQSEGFGRGARFTLELPRK